MNEAAPPLRICAFESRRADDVRSLIERQGGIAINAPSMREVPLDQNPEAFAFGARLLQGEFDIVIFLTGVGARGLMEILETRYAREELFQALGRTTVILRGPKPAAVFREWRLKFDFQVREPNTWRELLELVDAQIPVQGKRIAIQEYGLPSLELASGLRDRGAEIVSVPVYRWDLPADTSPLIAAIHSTIAGEFDVLMWTSSFQLTAVLTVAESLGLKQAWLAAARNCLIASVGPAASENLVSQGLPPDLEPDHPKMGQLVKATMETGRNLLVQKRSAGANFPAAD